MADRRTLADAAPALFRSDRHAVFAIYKTFRPLTLWVVIAAPNATPTYGELQDGDRLANHAVDLRRDGCPDDDRAPDFATARMAAIRRLIDPVAPEFRIRRLRNPQAPPRPAIHQRRPNTGDSE